MFGAKLRKKRSEAYMKKEKKIPDLLDENEQMKLLDQFNLKI